MAYAVDVRRQRDNCVYYNEVPLFKFESRNCNRRVFRCESTRHCEMLCLRATLGLLPFSNAILYRASLLYSRPQEYKFRSFRYFQLPAIDWEVLENSLIDRDYAIFTVFAREICLGKL